MCSPRVRDMVTNVVWISTHYQKQKEAQKEKWSECCA